jgi:hypothetical protein
MVVLDRVGGDEWTSAEVSTAPKSDTARLPIKGLANLSSGGDPRVAWVTARPLCGSTGCARLRAEHTRLTVRAPGDEERRVVGRDGRRVLGLRLAVLFALGTGVLAAAAGPSSAQVTSVIGRATDYLAEVSLFNGPRNQRPNLPRSLPRYRLSLRRECPSSERGVVGQFILHHCGKRATAT